MYVVLVGWRYTPEEMMAREKAEPIVSPEEIKESLRKWGMWEDRMADNPDLAIYVYRVKKRALDELAAQFAMGEKMGAPDARVVPDGVDKATALNPFPKWMRGMFGWGWKWDPVNNIFYAQDSGQLSALRKRDAVIAWAKNPMRVWGRRHPLRYLWRWLFGDLKKIAARMREDARHLEVNVIDQPDPKTHGFWEKGIGLNLGDAFSDDEDDGL